MIALAARQDIGFEMRQFGEGRPILFLHGIEGARAAHPFVQSLAGAGEVYVPSHPGFGLSAQPEDFRHIADLAYFYLEAMSEWNLRDVVLVGANLGGWLAAEIAVRSSERLSAFVALNSFGLKTKAADEPEIADFFAMSASDYQAAAFADAANGERRFSDESEEELTAYVRDREAAARYGWQPFMHSPNLHNWLRRIAVPALVLWGEHDRIVSSSYGQRFAAALPRADFGTITDAGLFPHVEQPAATAGQIEAFLATMAG
jgi:pimeloyl-ACP methyl ester carboxylesterase